MNMALHTEKTAMGTGKRLTAVLLSFRAALCSVFVPFAGLVGRLRPAGVCAVWLLAATWAQGSQTNETFSWASVGLDGWTHASAEVTLSNPGGYLNMQFAEQSNPYSVCDIVRTPVQAGMTVSGISFSFLASNTVPSEIRVCLYSTMSGRTWYLQLEAPPPGQWHQYHVPVNFAAGWIYGNGCTEAEFVEDMATVEWAGIYVRRNFSPASQNFGIDDVVLSEAMSGAYDSDGDGMPDVWEIQYGLNPQNPADAALDSDGDGISNLDEYRSGTNPKDNDSVLALDLVSDTELDAGGVVLRWNSAAGRIYSVWRTTNLLEGFTAVQTGIPGVPPVNEFRDDTAVEAGPYFYRIGVK